MQNKIVRTLLDESKKRGFSLDKLSTRIDLRDDREQFYLLTDESSDAARRPMQPFIVKNKVVRFKANVIVSTMLEESQKRGFGLNELARASRKFTQADWEEFYQLIGYSLCGYHELSFVSDETAREATKEAKKLDPEFAGCRDVGCQIHCGVEREERQ